MSLSTRLIRILTVALVTLIAFALRMRAVDLLPIDYDEDDYLRAGQQYAESLAAGDASILTRENYRHEHPPLAKIAYGLALEPLPPAPEVPDVPTTAPPARSLPQPHFTVARLTTAAFGTLEVFALSLINPLAGLFLAIHTWDIKYTSQIMLEGLPALTSALAILFYIRSRRVSKKWLALSAIALGLTAAAKYLYCVAGIAIVADWLWHTRPMRRDASSLWRWLRPALLWGAVSIVFFFVADPYLWPDPINRLKDSIVYHAGYTQSAAVQQAGFPTWQPLVWLAESVPWHPGVFIFSLDAFIGILALFGLRRVWARQRVSAIWLIVALGFLLMWTTKWPQYILILTFPLSLAGAEGFRAVIWEPITDRIRRRRARDIEASRLAGPRIGRRETRRALPWLVPGLLVLCLIVLYPLVFQSAMSLTDFTSAAIRDGINGGVWRAVAQGVSGQVEPVNFDPFGPPSNASRTVNYAGPTLLSALFSGALSDVLVFEVIWTLVSVGLQTALGMAVALALHQRGMRFAGWWRALFIVPWAMPEFVGALVWSRIFEPTTGALSVICGCPLEWVDNSNQTLLVLLIGATWMGWPLIMLAATAGLKLIPPEVYDAAALDGASRLSLLRHITWPLLLPLLAPAIIIRSIFAFNQFYLFVVMRTNYPNLTFAALSYYVFDTSGGGLYALSAVINLFTVVMLVVFLLFFNRSTGGRMVEGVTYA